MTLTSRRSRSGGVADPRIAVGRAIAGMTADDLIEHYGSPLFVYDGDVIRQRVAKLRDALPRRVDIAFATKANSSPSVLRTLSEAGLGADVASGGELRAATRAGFEASRVVFTGPGKTDAELAEALSMGIGLLTIESLDELEAVIGLAEAARPGQGLMLRLATGGEAEGTPIIGGAGNAKFGLTDDEADMAMGRLREAGVLRPTGPFRVRGFHAFGASNVLDARLLVDGITRLADRAERIADGHGLDIEILDGGGGLGIPYVDDDQPLDVVLLGEGLRQTMATWADRGSLSETRLLLEPGRWLVAPAGVYICRVTRTKVRDGHSIAITDGGIHHLLRPRLVGQDHRVVAVGRAADRAPDSQVDVVGPLCTGLDILASGVAAPAPHPGELLAVLDAGAYGYSESMPLFLSHPTPAEVLASDGVVVVSRERVEPA